MEVQRIGNYTDDTWSKSANLMPCPLCLVLKKNVTLSCNYPFIFLTFGRTSDAVFSKWQFCHSGDSSAAENCPTSCCCFLLTFACLFCNGHKRKGGWFRLSLHSCSPGIHCKPWVFPEENGTGCTFMWQAWCDVLHKIFLLLEGFVKIIILILICLNFLLLNFSFLYLNVITVILGCIWNKFFLVFSSASVGYRKITVIGDHVNWWKPFGSILRTLTRSWLDTAGVWLSSGTCRITKWHTISWAARY